MTFYHCRSYSTIHTTELQRKAIPLVLTMNFHFPSNSCLETGVRNLSKLNRIIVRPSQRLIGMVLSDTIPIFSLPAKESKTDTPPAIDELWRALCTTQYEVLGFHS